MLLSWTNQVPTGWSTIIRMVRATPHIHTEEDVQVYNLVFPPHNRNAALKIRISYVGAMISVRIAEIYDILDVK